MKVHDMTAHEEQSKMTKSFKRETFDFNLLFSNPSLIKMCKSKVQ